MTTKLPAKNIALIAGNGGLPEMILKKLQQKKIQPLIIGFEDISYNFFQPNYKFALTDIKNIISTLKKNHIKYVIFSGGVKFPDLKKLKIHFVDIFLAIKYFLFTKTNNGDDKILKILEKYCNYHGMQILGVDDIIPNILASKKDQVNAHLSKEYKKEIQLGIAAIDHLSSLDIGQAVIVQNNRIIAVEGNEGTDLLIKRVENCRIKTNQKPILIKKTKINQSRKIDLPTIGKNTILNLIKYNFAGIVLETNGVVIVDKEEVLQIAEDAGLFIKLC